MDLCIYCEQVNVYHDDGESHNDTMSICVSQCVCVCVCVCLCFVCSSTLDSTDSLTVNKVTPPLVLHISLH